MNLVAVWRVVPSSREHLQSAARRGAFAGLASLLRRGATRGSPIAFMLANMASFAILASAFTISPYLVDVASACAKRICPSIVYLAGGLASLVVAPLAGRLLDRFGAKAVFIVGALVSLPVIVLFTNLGPATLVAAVVVNAVMSAATAARMTPSWKLVNSAVERRRRGGFMTLLAAVQQLGASAWSYAAGIFLAARAGVSVGAAREAGFGTLGWGVAGVSLAAAGLAYGLRQAKD